MKPSILIFSVTALTQAISSAVVAGLFHVDDSAPGGGNGATWSTAYNRLEQALDAANANSEDETDTIRIAQGTYYPTQGTNRGVSFDLPPVLSFVPGVEVRIEGGYAGYGAEFPDDRNIGDYETILSGDIGNPLAIDNTYHVVKAISGGMLPTVDNRTILDGVTIRDGYAGHAGGGILLVNSFPVISRCTITQNQALDPGVGGLSGGGGLNCEFTSAVLEDDDYIFLTECTITGNVVEERGAGVMMLVEGSIAGGIAFIDCDLLENTSFGPIEESCGGAFHLDIPTPPHTLNFPAEVQMVNCRIIDNYARHLGGGFSTKAHSPAEVTLTNCVIAKNGIPTSGDATAFGGGLAIDGATIDMRGCTVADNAAHEGAGGLDADDTEEDPPGFIYNTIFYYNSTEGTVTKEIRAGGLDLTIDACAIEGGSDEISGTGEIVLGTILEDPPEFIGSGDYRLMGISPLLEQGVYDFIADDTFNLDGDPYTDKVPFDNEGNNRVTCDHVDIGAYERCQTPGCPADVNSNGIVDFLDVLAILGAWGNTGGPEDANGNGTVDFLDILFVISTWGPCAGCGCGPGPVSIPAMFDDMGLDYPADWLDFKDRMEHGSVTEQQNYACWMDHYYYAHFLQTCFCAPTCTGTDPWGNH